MDAWGGEREGKTFSDSSARRRTAQSTNPDGPQASPLFRLVSDHLHRLQTVYNGRVHARVSARVLVHVPLLLPELSCQAVSDLDPVAGHHAACARCRTAGSCSPSPSGCAPTSWAVVACSARLTEAFRRAVLRLFVRLALFDEDQAAGMLTMTALGVPRAHGRVGGPLRVPEDDRAFATRLARYCAPNPVALERLTYDRAGRRRDLPVRQVRGSDGGHRDRRPAGVPDPGAGPHSRPGPRHDAVRWLVCRSPPWHAAAGRARPRRARGPRRAAEPPIDPGPHECAPPTPRDDAGTYGVRGRPTAASPWAPPARATPADRRWCGTQGARTRGRARRRLSRGAGEVGDRALLFDALSTEPRLKFLSREPVASAKGDR
jgi:hypothetical protein